MEHKLLFELFFVSLMYFFLNLLRLRTKFLNIRVQLFHSHTPGIPHVLFVELGHDLIRGAFKGPVGTCGVRKLSLLESRGVGALSQTLGLV